MQSPDRRRNLARGQARTRRDPAGPPARRYERISTRSARAFGPPWRGHRVRRADSAPSTRSSGSRSRRESSPPCRTGSVAKSDSGSEGVTRCPAQNATSEERGGSTYKSAMPPLVSSGLLFFSQGRRACSQSHAIVDLEAAAWLAAQVVPSVAIERVAAEWPAPVRIARLWVSTCHPS